MSAHTRKILNCVLRKWHLRQTQDVSNNFDDIPGPILFYGNEICGGMWRFWTILYVQKPNRFLVREHDFGGTNLRVFHVTGLVGKLKLPIAYPMLSLLKKLTMTCVEVQKLPVDVYKTQQCLQLFSDTT